MIGSILLLLLGIVVIAIIIAANGFFVAQEFAYMSVDRSRLRARAAEGDAAAKRALAVTRRTSFMLSGAQLGITVTGLLVGYVAEPLVGAALGDILGVAGIPAAVSISIGTLLALVVATVVQMIFGELFPKNLAIAAPEPLARALATPTRIYLAVFGWLIVVFDKSSDALLRLLKVEPVHDVDSSANADDLEHIIDDSHRSGDLPDELTLVLDRILDFPSRTVEHAMVPRARVDVVRDDLLIGALRELMATAHSRYPVVDESQRAVGVVHLLDVLGASHGETVTAGDLQRPPLVVPELMSLPDALGALIDSHSEMAVVVDEYGGFAGILTVEDIAEEVMGEIRDEHDDADDLGIRVVADGVWDVDGDLPLDEVERSIGHDLPRGDYETLAGLLIAERGAFPEVGEVIRVAIPGEFGAISELLDDGPVAEATVLEVDSHVPARVELRLIVPMSEDAADVDAAVTEEEGR